MSDAWEDRLRERSYRVTPQRQLVLQAVRRLGHGTPDEILAEVQRTATGVNLSTVYRNLEVLADVGLVTHAHIGHGAPTYHAIDDDPHLHLVCDACGDVLSAPAAEAAAFAAHLERAYGFRADVTHAAVHGRCRSCQLAGSEDDR